MILKNPGIIPLAYEFRGELLDTIQFGYFCVLDENGKIIWNGGNSEIVVCYRSSSKPIQALPTLVRRLDEKYDLTQEETSLFAASHKGEPFHVKALLSILEKTGLSENDMIMNPCAPTEIYSYDGVPRRLYHNCSGKHISLMLLQRELTGTPAGYHCPDSPAQQEVKQTIACISGCDESHVSTALDGCGVPVYSVPLKQMAGAFLRMACPEMIRDKELSRSAVKIRSCMNMYPLMIRGTGSLDYYLNRDPNIIAKSGANGLFCLGLSRERLGIAVKLIDGMPDWLPFMIRHILIGLKYDNQGLLDDLEKLHPDKVVNDCGLVAGHREFVASDRS